MSGINVSMTHYCVICSFDRHNLICSLPTSTHFNINTGNIVYIYIYCISKQYSCNTPFQSCTCSPFCCFSCEFVPVDYPYFTGFFRWYNYMITPVRANEATLWSMDKQTINIFFWNDNATKQHKSQHNQSTHCMEYTLYVSWHALMLSYIRK